MVERVGRIKVVKDGKVQAEPFLDLTGATRPLGGEVQTQFIEQGLYSVAFHPNFKANGYFYVHYASLPFNGDGFIVRFTAKDGVKADPESAKVIYIIDQPWYNHNGGQIAFGPDGMLYIGSGDGGWEGDPLDAGQRLDTDLGKILRIDVNVPETQIQAYNIPQDNPFIWRPQLMALFGVTDKTFASLHPTAKPEIWAYGVRNPWMFSFDNKTGDLYIADVGQSEMEAIYYQPRSSKGGENYGWKDRFGTKCFPMDTTGCAKVGAPPAARVLPQGWWVCRHGLRRVPLGAATEAGRHLLRRGLVHRQGLRARQGQPGQVAAAGDGELTASTSPAAGRTRRATSTP